MKNNLTDLNNYLFGMIEELTDAQSDEEITKAVSKSKAMCNVSNSIVENAKLMLDATKLQVEYGRRDINLPKMLDSKE